MTTLHPHPHQGPLEILLPPRRPGPAYGARTGPLPWVAPSRLRQPSGHATRAEFEPYVSRFIISPRAPTIHFFISRCRVMRRRYLERQKSSVAQRPRNKTAAAHALVVLHQLNASRRVAAVLQRTVRAARRSARPLCAPEHLTRGASGHRRPSQSRCKYQWTP